MGFNAGRWAPLLGPESASALTASSPMAGMGAASSLGSGSYEDFQKLVGNIPAEKLESFMQYATIAPLINASMRQFDPEWRKNELKMQEDLATKRGWKSLMFNQLGAGLENLTKGIAMSMNPYGTPEAARYVADMAANRGASQGAGFAAVRTPMSIPIVQGGSSPTYF